MIAGRAGAFHIVGNVIRAFQSLGCELRVAEAEIRDAEGEVFSVRYLLNPANGRFVGITYLADADKISQAEVESWERALELAIFDGL